MEKEGLSGRMKEQDEITVFPSNAIRVCIDEVNHDIAGRAYSKMSSKEIPFHGCMELFLRVDKLFDAVGYPQAFWEKRTFLWPQTRKKGYSGIPKSQMEDAELQEKQGSFATFDIFVQSRRRGSWQGYLKKCNGAVVEFQSEMELLHMAEQFIRTAKVTQQPCKEKDPKATK